jgi:PAS domain S-box-containing protein
MKIRTKVLLGFALIAAIGMVLGIAGLFSVRSLTEMTGELHSMQSTSRNVEGVLNAHYIWRGGLTEAVLKGTGDAFTGALNPDMCALGTWRASDDGQNVSDPEVLSLLEQINEPHHFIHTEAAKVIELMGIGESEEAQAFLIGSILPKVEEVTSLLSDIEERYAVLSEELSVEMENLEVRLNTVIISLIVAAMAACIIIAVILSGWIVKKIHWYEQLLDSIPLPLSVTDTKRNWTFVNKPVEVMLGVKRAEVIGKPCSNWGAGICNTDNCGINCLECGKTSTTFDQMGLNFKVDVAYLTDLKGKRIGHIEAVQNITEIIKTQKSEAELVENIGQVSHSFVMSAGQIADGAQALAQGATEQAASIEELSGSIADVAERTKENAAKAGQASKLADAIKENAEKGTRQMSEMMTAVKDINQSSQGISKVIKVIDDIAFQTNILALNAAVEAARAGQHGKGFAVVAEEVRNLATKSAEAAKDTENLIATSLSKTELGVTIAEETGASLNEIASGISESNRLIAEIALSSDEQSLAIAQINTGIDQVAQVVQQNSATAEESAAASEEMSSQAAMLQQLIAEFEAKSTAANGIALSEGQERKRLSA